ncbi:MAG: SIS domain-containing protein [Chloroflexi bacterium]|jgi:D-sedoheptulose 7-phosphate isomerase|nr:MAG: SIS domain-containing protein [Chloroflexota bacterium]
MQLMERPQTTATVLEGHINDVRTVLSAIPIDAIERAVGIILDAYDNGAHVYVVGNGGSATNATHFACDLSKATIVDGRARLRVTSLTDNIALLTAWANDTSYDRVFSEQLTNLLDPGDVVIAISASGNSPNVVSAVLAARLMRASTIALVGFAGGRLLEAVDAAIHVPSNDYGVVEDCHSVIEHAITVSTRKALLA